MTSSTLYIPKTLVVGFQKRSDTFTGKLAYVIYKDHTGKLRKEASWNSWRDKTITTIEVDNVATPNFTLNKGVQRSREWFGSGRSMVRVWDPRDFEFEITVDNLLNVLMHADVSKRDITEPCVYAWQGSNLVLLPTNSVEYEESIKHTDKQSKKVSSRELVVGRVYSIKADAATEVIYLGRQERYTIETYDEQHCVAGKYQQHKKSKAHVFMDIKTKEVLVKEPSAYLAGELSDQVHPDLAALLDFYYSSAESQQIVGASLAPSVYIPDNEPYLYRYMTKSIWFALSDTEFVQIQYGDENTHYHSRQNVTSGTVIRFARFDTERNRLDFTYKRMDYDYGRYNYVTRQQDPARHFISAQRNLPGLSEQDPRVQELMAKVQALPQIKDRDNAVDYTAEQRRILNAYNKAAAALGGSCYLTFKLADGKLAHDHHA
jgi:hypothetical protein